MTDVQLKVDFKINLSMGNSVWTCILVKAQFDCYKKNECAKQELAKTG